MKRVAVIAVFALMVSCVWGAVNQPPPPTLEGAQWIWALPDAGANTFDPDEGACFLRANLVFPQKAALAKAEVFITADNLFALYFNGKFAGESSSNPNAWSQPKRFDVTSLIVPGRNVIAVEAVNTAPGPAGLIVKLVASFNDGRRQEFVSDGKWKAAEKHEADWQKPNFNDSKWLGAYVIGPYGAGPWGNFGRNLASRQVEQPGPAPTSVVNWKRSDRPRPPRAEPVTIIETPPADFVWPDGVLFVGDDCSLYRGEHPGTSHDSLGVTMFTARKSRSYPEHDLPTPIKMGRKLYALKPARPGAKPQVLLDAGKGAIGTPCVSFDGRTIYLAMAQEGEAFFHIYKMPAQGGKPERLTDGPFHDIDPAELPDGRIVFTSTRIGTFEEYHCPPARALFVMESNGRDIQPLTSTIIFDNEARVMADGRILFIRSDNFFDRGKVETLLHAVHPDGREGYTEFSLDNGPEYGSRLRAFYCGSPAPMPDGRVAFVSNQGITVGKPGSKQEHQQHFKMEAGDVAALPDGRLMCTLARTIPKQGVDRKTKKPITTYDFSYEKIGIFDPSAGKLAVTLLHDSKGAPLHTPVYLGPRKRPPVLPNTVTRSMAENVGATGFLFCNNARLTKNTAAGWQHVRAIRVLMGKGLTVRSSHAYIVHAGNETVELGTVPLAPDGSFHVEVPADRAIAFQAVDAEGRSELNEMSWIFVRPGERRSCVGCHQSRQVSPDCSGKLAQALQTPPLRLLGQGQPHRFRGNNAAVTGMMEVQFDRYRETEGLNRHAETADPLSTGAQETSQLVAQLADNDSALRTTATQRLALRRDPAAAPALAQRLLDQSREVRVAAAMALAACGTRDSIEPLLASLTDPDPLVGQAAAVALENLTGHNETFSAFVEPDDRAREAGKWRTWFRHTNWSEIEQELIRRIENPDRDIVRRAAVALGHIGNASARSAVRAYVAREREKNPYPEWAKTHRGDGAKFNATSEANPRTLQAVTRTIGCLEDEEALPMLADTVAKNSDPAKANLFLAEAAIEAIGRIATPQAEDALVSAMRGLQDYFYYTGWYGDHGALYACHGSPVHYLIAEALDTLGSKRAAVIVPNLIRMVPTDPDRALFPYNDDCETLAGRVIRRQGMEQSVVETCLAMLGDPVAARTTEIADAISTTYQAWAGKPDPENRAAHILSLVCRSRSFEPRVRAALDRYRAKPDEKLKRDFAGGGLPRSLPVKNWVCFFLARSLGNLADSDSVNSLVAVLEQCPAEAAAGYPDPASAASLFLHNELTPCYRAAAAWALGRIADKRAAPTLLRVIANLENAPDTRFAAAEALERVADANCRDALHQLAMAYPEVSTRKVLLRVMAKLTR